MPEMVFQVDQREGNLIVTSGEFYAVYFKPVRSASAHAETPYTNG